MRVKRDFEDSSHGPWKQLKNLLLVKNEKSPFGGKKMKTANAILKKLAERF